MTQQLNYSTANSLTSTLKSNLRKLCYSCIRFTSRYNKCWLDHEVENIQYSCEDYIRDDVIE